MFVYFYQQYPLHFFADKLWWWTVHVCVCGVDRYCVTRFCRCDVSELCNWSSLQQQASKVSWGVEIDWISRNQTRVVGQADWFCGRVYGEWSFDFEDSLTHYLLDVPDIVSQITEAQQVGLQSCIAFVNEHPCTFPVWPVCLRPVVIPIAVSIFICLSSFFFSFLMLILLLHLLCSLSCDVFMVLALLS